jgi:hypothetical protein
MRLQQEQHDYDYGNSCGNLHGDGERDVWFRDPDYHCAVDGKVERCELLHAFQDHSRRLVCSDDAIYLDGFRIAVFRSSLAIIR